MNQDLLDALNNLSKGLEKISDALENKSKSNNSLSSSLNLVNIDESLKQINNGIKKLQEDNKKILDNQKTILEMSKSNKVNKFEEASTPKQQKSIKSGVSNIILIAVGVLAIGSAFKLLGDVDFKSVLALSISLPLVALAFEKIGSTKISVGNIASLILITVGISSAIWLSSKILSNVQPIGLYQLTTAILIAGMFATISYNIDKLTKGLSNLSTKSIIMIPLLPIILVGISIAISKSSNYLKQIQPVGIYQMITSILIAGMFAVISYGLGKLISSLKGITLTNALIISGVMPLVLVGISYSIMKSSEYLSRIQPLSLTQLLTSIGIALVFIPISYALPFLSKSMEKINVGKVLLLPVILTAMAVSIYYSSIWLSKTIPIGIGKLINISLLSITLALIGISLGVSFKILGKLDITETLKGGLNLVIISTAIWLSSLLLNKGEYGNFPSIAWAVGFSITSLLLAIPVTILGMVGLPIVAMGSAGLVLIAGAILISSFILSKINPEFFYKISDAIGYFINVMSNAVAYGLKIIAPALNTFINVVGDSLVKFAKNILPPIVQAMGDLTEKVVKPLLNLIVTSLPTIGKFLETIINNVIPLVSIIISGVKSMFNTISGIFHSIVSIIDAIGNKISSIINSIGDNVTKVVDSIGNTFKKIGGVFDSVANVINSVVGGIERIAKVGFMDLTKSGANILDFMDTIIKSTSRFKELSITVSPLLSVANSYDKLADGLKKINTQLISLDTEKLLALKNMTGSVVMMSLMDPSQFEKMMSVLESKAPLFRDVMDDISNGSKRTEISQINSPRLSKSSKSIDDLYDILSQVAISTSSIASDSNKLSRYVDEIRGGDVISLNGK